MSDYEIAKRAADLLEARDLKGFQALLADDFRAKGGTLELNKQQSLGYFQMFFTAFPDHSFGFANFETGEMDGWISCTAQETGTHKGVLDLHPFGKPISLPPTGRSFKLPQCVFTFRVAGDKVTYISESTGEGGGLAGILEQLEVKLS